MSETAKLDQDIEKLIEGLASYSRQSGVPTFVADAASIWAVEHSGLSRALAQVKRMTKLLNDAAAPSPPVGLTEEECAVLLFEASREFCLKAQPDLADIKWTDEGDIADKGREMFRHAARAVLAAVNNHQAGTSDDVAAAIAGDRQWLAGAKFGWNCGTTGDRRKYDIAVNGRMSEIAAATSAPPKTGGQS